MFREEDIRAVQQFNCQCAQLKMYEENIGLIRIIGLQYGVHDMDAYLQDAYLALNDACRVYKWDKSFIACYRIHLKKAVFKHRYLYEYPVKVNYRNCKDVTGAEMPEDVPTNDESFTNVENKLILSKIYDAIKTLTDMDRSIVRMRFFEDKTLREIAEICGVSSVTIYNHITKIINMIRSEIY